MTNHTRRLAGALSITLLSIVLAACGGATPSASDAPASAVTAAPASVAPEASPSAAVAATPASSLATTGRIAVADKGFAITLPDGWTRLDITPEALDAAMAANDVDPAMAAQISAQMGMLGDGLAVFAFGPDPSETGTQVTVLALPAMGLSLDLLDQINKSQLENLAEGDVVSERVTLPAGDAIHYRYAIEIEGTPGATLDQYFVLAGSNQLVVTATNATEAEATAIANSIEVLD